MDINKTSTLIAVCEKLLKMKLGDRGRIETIKARAEQGRILYELDKKYVEKMAAYIKYEDESKPEIKSEEKKNKVHQKQTHFYIPEQETSSEDKSKKRFSFFERKKKPKEEPRKKDWFFDRVEFRRQSTLALIIGILQVIGSFVFLIYPMGDFMMKVVIFFIAMLFGFVMISLGSRRVPNYSSLRNSIQEYIDERIKNPRAPKRTSYEVDDWTFRKLPESQRWEM